MAKKISEDTEVQLDLKTIGMIVGGAIALAATYFTLQADIELAKELISLFVPIIPIRK